MNSKRKVLLGLAALVVVGGVALGIYHHQAQNTYEHKVFDTSQVHQIDINVNADDWQDLQANAMNKEKYHADITVDGDAFKNVALSAKGSNSLRQIAKSGSTRYSLKINFGKYEDDQTYYGLDKLDLNNSLTDPSEIKDYISFYMFDRMGVKAPLCSYAWVRVNDHDYGLFIALEEVDDSYLERNFDGEGHLYKPETEEIADVNADKVEQITAALADNTADQLTWDKQEIMEFQPLSKGADLRYTSDDPDDYAEIFDNAVDDVDKDDEQRVISALKGLAQGIKSEAAREDAGDQLETVIDTDEVLRYFVVHNFTNNFDSYTGGINHNYYLYENDGQLQMLPWDYDFLNILTTDATADKLEYPAFYRVDTSIDKPLYYQESARPMWTWITAGDSYLDQYHELYDQFLSECLESGDVKAEITRVSKMLRPYVKKDPTKTYTLADFDATVKDLQKFCRQRTDSIRHQLEQ